METQTVAAPVTGTLAGAVAAPVAGLDPAEWLTIPAAAAVAGVLERTVRRWIKAGQVASQIDLDGRRRVQRSTLPAPEVATGAANDTTTGNVTGSTATATPASDSDTGTDTGSTAHESGPCSCCQVRESEVGFLRAQVERQAEELQRHAIAEEQLRVMLMKLEATNAELAGALVQKALPPAAAPVKRTRWWQLWR